MNAPAFWIPRENQTTCTNCGHCDEFKDCVLRGIPVDDGYVCDDWIPVE